jgi:hypothetical protein
MRGWEVQIQPLGKLFSAWALKATATISTSGAAPQNLISPFDI